MAKKALLDVLEQTIGKYVKNLDAESLNVAVWSGKIALNNLELDVDAVNAELDRRAAEAPNLALPVEVVSGKFQVFEVDVPWASLTSRSVILRARGLHIDVRPFDRLAATDHLQASVQSEEARTIKIKQSRQKSIEISEKYREQAYVVQKLAADTDERGEQANSKSTKSSFSSRLVRRIIENIQIEISDVHVRLTDTEGSAGVVLDKLSLVTTDREGKQVFVDRNKGKDADGKFLHKLLLLQGFGIYLDHEDYKTEKFVTAKTSLGAISEHNHLSTSSPPPIPNPAPILDHSYVLSPLSFQAKLRQADGKVFTEYPKYQLSSELSSLSILLSKQQLELARHICKGVASSNGQFSYPIFPEYRPMTRINSGKSAREWWKYAVRCIGRLNGRRSWVEFLYAYQKRKQYIPLYKRQTYHHDHLWLSPLTKEEQQNLDAIEQDRTISVEGIMIWRNIAQGQFDMEKEKHETHQKKKKDGANASYFSSIFGSSKTVDHGKFDETDPPIHLTTTELKELEAMAKEQFEDDEVSKDSKLYDVGFILRSLRINLLSYDMSHLAALEMGAVSLDFAAAANGAFSLDFDLTDLEVQDRVTPNSLFPNILKSLPMESYAAFHLHLSKTKYGDQNLKVQLAALEMVASHTLFKELKLFIDGSSATPSTGKKKENPILAQSMSGSVDLFYDAEQGASSQNLSEPTAFQNSEAFEAFANGAARQQDERKMTDDLSHALVDAWKEKTANKSTWAVDLDIKAPLVLLPEKCNDPRANVLIFDLGQFRFTYGNSDNSPQVDTWFQEHRRKQSDKADLTMDSGRLVFQDLTFKVGKSSDWRLAHQRDAMDFSNENSVVEPISMTLSIGVESKSHSVENPRVCCIGVIPTVSVRMSPIQGSSILSVMKSWIFLLEAEKEVEVSSRNIPQTETLEEGKEWIPCTKTNDPTEDEVPIFYFLIGLQRLSLTLSLDARNYVEAHLVSAYMSIQMMPNGNSSIGLRMGWFWILDMLESKRTRRQRLLAHSNLPKSAESFAEKEKYNILEELETQGVFCSDYNGSTDLANIEYRTIRHVSEGREQEYTENVINADFSSLYLHWNPYAINGLSKLSDRYFTLAEDYDETSTLIMTPSKRMSDHSRQYAIDLQEKDMTETIYRLTARMHRLDLSLNSARDDLPIFVLTVADAEVKSSTSPDDFEASMKLGDMRIVTPQMGRTLTSYRTLLGLAPGRKESLLSAKYYQGTRAIGESSLTQEKCAGLEAYAVVNLSPMRLYYIQSQIMALVEYCTEGILGNLTSKAANSAAQRAIEYAESVSGKKIFQIHATAFDMVLPQSAISTKTVRIQAGHLDAEYVTLPGVGGSTAYTELSEVVMYDTDDILMQENPIKMILDVSLPVEGIGSLDDEAMRVCVRIVDVNFVVKGSQYQQICATMTQNVGELELFLRDTSYALGDRSNSSQNMASEDGHVFTHAGIEFIEKQRRMYITVVVDTLALQLCDQSGSELVRIAAVNGNIEYDSHPDVSSTSSRITLHNLICEDLREQASWQQHRYLVRQTANLDSDEALFFIGYTSGSDDMSLDVKVGSPQVVLIPDIISEILEFVKGDALPENTTQERREIARSSSLEQGRTFLDSMGTSEVEATLVPSGKLSRNHLAINTKTCQFILVDVGNQPSKFSNRFSQLTETIVLQGVFSGVLSYEIDNLSGTILQSEFNGQADAMEIFSAFGKNMRSPLQILEPSEGSAHGSLKSRPNSGIIIEVRAATLTPIEFTVSMHNIALLSTIVNSLQVIFVNEEVNETRSDAIDLNGLSTEERNHIESLSSALEVSSTEKSRANYEASSSSIEESSVRSSSSGIANDIPGGKHVQLRFTMPETTFTVINDLQGLDEALLRASFINFVAGANVQNIGLPDSTFDVHVNTSILADYFDTSCNIWNNLLVEPWEMTLKGLRVPSRRFKSSRLSTTMDIESFPCAISFSEQFLVSLASASQMWSIYSVATSLEGNEKTFSKTGSRKATMAAKAARNLVTSMPYAIENNTGIDAKFTMTGKEEVKHICPNNSIQYFRFEPPRGKGYGGKRVYGQDLTFDKYVTVYFADGTDITIGHSELEMSQFNNKRIHKLKSGGALMTDVVKEGKTTVLHISSFVCVINNTSLSFRLTLEEGNATLPLGKCAEFNLKKHKDSALQISDSGIATRDSSKFNLPVDHLLPAFRRWKNNQTMTLNLSLHPALQQDENMGLHGEIHISFSLLDLHQTENGKLVNKMDVSCQPSMEQGKLMSSLVVQVIQSVDLLEDGGVKIDIRLEPRALIKNNFPIPISLRTPMPHTFSLASPKKILENDVMYTLHSGEIIEIFTPGPSIAITVKTAEAATSGTDIEWLHGGWIDLPLVQDFRLLEPVRCMLPFSKAIIDDLDVTGARGVEFFLVEDKQSLLSLVAPEEGAKDRKSPIEALEQKKDSETPLRTFYATVCYYGIDHTGDILFEQVQRSDPIFKVTMGEASVTSLRASRRHSRKLSATSSSLKMTPFSAFASSDLSKRITLLPSGNIPLRVLQMSPNFELGFRRSLPFFVEELPIGEKGADTLPLLWESKQPSGYYVYRKILNEHQSEVHVIPEFQVFNGSKHAVLIEEKHQTEVIIEAGGVAGLAVSTRPSGLGISLNFIEIDCQSSFLRVDKLGLKVVILKSRAGVAVGSVCVQTVIDTHGDSRLVVKIGEINSGQTQHESQRFALYRGDFFRFRIRWTELHLILNELQKPDKTWSMQKAFSKWNMTPTNREASANSYELATTIVSSQNSVEVEEHSKEESINQANSRFKFPLKSPKNSTAPQRAKLVEVLQQPVASIRFSRFTFDFQRVFKEHETKTKSEILTSPERSQISLIIHNIIIKDLTPNSIFPMVFDCSSPDCSFLDLCVRIRGPVDAEMVKVDLFQLNLAHSKNGTERIKLTTSEEYVWKMIDLLNRILAASGDFAGYSLKLEEDPAHGGFIVKIVDSKKSRIHDEVTYTPPKSDTLYDIDIAKVSPFSLLVSFKRSPQLARYKKVGANVTGSSMMNYFSRKLKFTIDRAELNFSKYEDRSLRGPADRLFESLSAVYVSRMKFKLVTLLTAASLQDWKYLAARGQGDDEYVEGDILRVAGNLTGKASNMIFKRAGKRVGDGVSDFTRAFGSTIESATDRIGVGRVGASVNNVVTGVGDGVGSTISGVGSGTGKILRGAGQGLGHAFGGVAGGALQISKGIGKGITKGDGKAVVTGVQQGLSSAGSGLATGAQSTVVGAADGIFSAGRGIFTGVKSVGKGIGGAFTGKKQDRKYQR